jgi:hypothetical protein
MEQNKKDKLEGYHHFRLFSYLSMMIITVAIIIGLFIIMQHLSEEEETAKSIANQETLLKNQGFLVNITEAVHNHEQDERAWMEMHRNISIANGEKLDKIIKILKHHKNVELNQTIN